MGRRFGFIGNVTSVNNKNKPMSYKINKVQSLKQLSDFCSRNKVYGWCSNMWYHGLKNAYPLEFLLFTQYSTNHPNSRIFAKNIYSNKVNLKIQKLLVAVWRVAVICPSKS